MSGDGLCQSLPGLLPIGQILRETYVILFKNKGKGKVEKNKIMGRRDTTRDRVGINGS